MCALKKARHVLVEATPKNEAESPQHLEDRHDSLLALAPQLQRRREDRRAPKVIYNFWTCGRMTNTQLGGH